MKRKWIWGLAIVPLIIGFIVAKSLADKRPRLVARGVNAKNLSMSISPDGKWLYTAGRTIEVAGNASFQFPLSETDFDGPTFFCENGTRLCQFSYEIPPCGFGVSCHSVLSLRSARSGKVISRFDFPDSDSTINVYGASLQGNEIVVESQQKTWRFQVKNLRFLSLQKRQRTLPAAGLCPDGKTLYRGVIATKTLEFRDLHTEKLLWTIPQEISRSPQFSFDGALFLMRKKGEIIAYDTRTGKENWRFHGPQSSAIALSPDQSAIYEARPNGELWKWPR